MRGFSDLPGHFYAAFRGGVPILERVGASDSGFLDPLDPLDPLGESSFVQIGSQPDTASQGSDVPRETFPSPTPPCSVWVTP